MAAAGYPEIKDPEACFKLRDRCLSFGKISLRDAVRDVPADKPAAACSVYRFFVGRGDIAADAEGKSPLYAVERRVRQQRYEQIGISRAVGGAELYAPPAARFRQADRLTGFGAPAPFRPTKEDTIFLNRENAAQLRKEVEEEIRAEREAKLKPEPECPPGMISEGEARRILIEKAIKEGDQAAVLAIQQEDGPQFRARWDRYIETLKKEKAIKEAAARGPSQETRKALREKRKKRK